MARKRAVIPSRRRGAQEDEGEDDVLAGDESLTDDSGLSEDEEDEDKDLTDLSDEEEDEDAGEAELSKGMKGLAVGQKESIPVAPVVKAPPTKQSTTQVNGVNGDTGATEDAEVEIKEAKGPAEESEAGKHGVDSQSEETPLQRRRREHEAYKKQRDADPAFVPNRGRFFMHDHRHGRGGANGFRPFGRGFVRRGGMVAPGLNRDSTEPPSPATDRWKHDMHEETIKDEEKPAPQAPAFQPTRPREQPAEQGRNFGRTHLKGTVQIIVNLPGMKSPITFSEVPYRVYTKLPLHRPPLRRDKPVRIALADAPVRYIYPTVARSFVFIPRNMRPNQQHSIARGGRFAARPRSFVGQFQRPLSNFANQSPGASRRSSAYIEQPQEAAVATEQPAHVQLDANAPEFTTTTTTTTQEEDTRPVVKLPPSTTQDISTSGQSQEQAPIESENNHPVAVKLPPVSSYPTPPAQPIQAVRPTSTIPMHQPRPQKTVAMADLENPASLPANYPHGGPGVLTHSRNPSFLQTTEPPQPLPETAVHAPPFQPSYVYPPPYFFPGHMMSPPAPPHMDAYGNPHDPRSFGGMPPPPPFGSPFNVSAPPFAPIPASAPPTTAGNAIAQEQNGTVYFYEPSQYYAAYGPPFPMMPMPMTPAPDGMPPPGADGMGDGATVMNGMYYYPPPIPAQGVYYGP